MADFVCAKFEDITEPRTKAKIEEGLIGEPRPGNDAVLSPAEQLEINLAKPRQNHRVLKLPCRRIAGAGNATAPACSSASARARRSATIELMTSRASPGFRSPSASRSNAMMT